MSALPPKQAFTDCDLDSVRVSAFGHKQTFAPWLTQRLNPRRGRQRPRLRKAILISG